MQLHSILTILSAAVLASAAKLIVSIPPSPPALPNPATLPASTHATLLGAPGIKFSAPLRRDNTFVFPSLPEDSYLLTIHTRDYFFSPYRVDVGHTEQNTEEVVHVWQTFRGNEWDNKGPALGSGQGELRVEVRPGATKEFYLARGGFNLLGFVKSPMILMGLVSVVMIFGMPYLMENSEALIARALRLNIHWMCADDLQWIRRPRRSLRRCRRTARSPGRAVRRTRFKTSIWRASCLASRMSQLAVGRRRSRCQVSSQYRFSLGHSTTSRPCDVIDSAGGFILVCVCFRLSQVKRDFRGGAVGCSFLYCMCRLSLIGPT